jgi:hypothetical protein
VRRRQIFRFHNGFLALRLNADFFRQIAGSGAHLWRATQDGRTYEIRLRAVYDRDREGDLALDFASADGALCTLLFTFAPTAFGATMLVVCIQGARGRWEAIRRATRDCDDIAPAHLLLAAAEGVALALSAPTAHGVGNREQLSKSRTDADFTFDYDAFWMSVGARRTRGWYELPVPFPHRALADLPATHRRRTRRKRRFKAGVRDDVVWAFETRFALVPQPPAESRVESRRLAEHRPQTRHRLAQHVGRTADAGAQETFRAGTEEDAWREADAGPGQDVEARLAAIRHAIDLEEGVHAGLRARP